MAEGKIVNVGGFSSPFKPARTPSQGIEGGAMGMRESSASPGSSKLGQNAIQVHVPPSTGGSGGIKNVGNLQPGAKPIK